MEWITQEEAFEMGKKAFFAGLPESAFYNQDFWSRSNQIDSHKAWAAVMRAYVEGWRNAEGKVPL